MRLQADGESGPTGQSQAWGTEIGPSLPRLPFTCTAISTWSSTTNPTSHPGHGASNTLVPCPSRSSSPPRTVARTAPA
jgi:hypothetical protein